MSDNIYVSFCLQLFDLVILSIFIIGCGTIRQRWEKQAKEVTNCMNLRRLFKDILEKKIRGEEFVSICSQGH